MQDADVDAGAVMADPATPSPHTSASLGKGLKFQVVTGFVAPVSVMFHAPFSDRYQQDIPPGLEFELVESQSRSGHVAALPVDRERWMPQLVKPEDWEHELFGGAYILVPLEELERSCRPT